MEASPTVALHNARVDFLADQLALIHIPSKLYHQFLRSILQLLVNTENWQENGENPGYSAGYSDQTGDKSQLSFVNVSITPVECSVVCTRWLAQRLFVPEREQLDSASRKQVTISEDDYLVIQVGGEGLDAGQRVVALTHPLAMAGISIFFITTYFSDYLLVPQKSYGQVKTVLRANGFEFDSNNTGQMHAQHIRNKSSTSSAGVASLPSPQPPMTTIELQSRTFAALEQRNIRPFVDKNIRLLQCAGTHSDHTRHLGSSGVGGISNSAGGANGRHPSIPNAEIQAGLVKILIDNPRFLSITLTDTEQPSILVEESHIAKFSSPNILLGSQSDVLVPIILDLHDLPLESTGIVWGVAYRLVESDEPGLNKPVDMSYLSTARAGTVMVAEAELDGALRALSGDKPEALE